jgi:hypothetical protein
MKRKWPSAILNSEDYARMLDASGHVVQPSRQSCAYPGQSRRIDRFRTLLHHVCFTDTFFLRALFFDNAQRLDDVDVAIGPASATVVSHGKVKVTKSCALHPHNRNETQHARTCNDVEATPHRVILADERQRVCDAFVVCFASDSFVVSTRYRSKGSRLRCLAIDKT